MNKPVELPQPVTGKQKMTPSEAFVETLVANGVRDVFGIVGSAYMDALDLFPLAGIRFISVAHEQGGGHMADGYARVSGRHGVCIAQNGPGITNFVTSTAAAFWAHSPVVVITPETGSATIGLGGFQETEQLPIFSKITKFQAHVNNRARMAELTARAFDRAHLELGPTQLNIPRDFFYGDIECEIPRPMTIERGAGGEKSLDAAAELLASAKFPVILCGGGVVMADGQPEAIRLAELLAAPVANSYLHNDSFPAKHPLWAGPLGYQGSKAAMKLIAKADVVLALGTRLGPFGTLPQYGMEYWPKDAKIIQVDADAKMLGLVKPISVGVCGDARAAALALVARLSGKSLACHANKEARLADVAATKKAWEAELDGWTHETDAWSLEVSKSSTHMHPRQMLRELERAMPDGAMVSTDIGNICSVSNSYLRFDRPRSMFAAMSFGNCGYAFPTIMGAKVAAPDRPAIAYVGDGAWGMSFGEIQTCVRENIPVTAVVGRRREGDGRRGTHDRQEGRRRTCAARRRGGAARRQDDDPRDDGDARARRPVPARCAGAADASPREIQGDGREARLSGRRPGWRASPTGAPMVMSAANAMRGTRSQGRFGSRRRAHRRAFRIPMPASLVVRCKPVGNRVPRSGRALRIVSAALAAAVTALAMAGCSREAGPTAASAAAAPSSVAVNVLQVAPQRVPVVFSAVGQIEGAKQVEVRARVSGILQRQLYKEGDSVRAGAPLFQIDRAPFEIALAQARAQFEQDKARTEQTRREEARLKPLAEDRAISRKEYDDALSAAQLAAAAQQQSAAKVREAELNLSYTLVTAPVPGVSGRAEHSEGTLITTDAAGSLLTTINQVNPIWVRFSLAQSDLAKIPSGHLGGGGPVDVRLVLPDGSRYPGKGRLNFAAAAFDTKLGTMQLRAEFDNPKEQLLPGQFVRVLVTAGVRDNVFLVPQAAVMQTEKAFLVFVVDADNKAALRTVQMGEWVGSDWMVLSGLDAGDRVIVDNLLKVRPGAAVTPNAASAGGAKAPGPDKAAPNAK